MVKELTNKKSDQKIKAFALEFYEKQSKFKKYQAEYEKSKTELSSVLREYLEKSKINKFTFKNGNIPFSVQNVKQRKIVFDVEKLESKLSKKVFNTIVKKEYKINDFNGLVKYLKSCGVDPNVFKQYIDVEKVVDKDKIDELGEAGVIKINDIKDCYTIYENAGYIKITELED